MERQFGNVHVKRFLYFNLYVIQGCDGDILIDTGFVGMKKRLKKWLDQFQIKLIILTHAHVDHIWNVAYIQSLYGCEVAIGWKDVENIDNARIHSKPTKSCYNWWTKLMNFGMRKFVPDKFDVNLLLKNNQTINRYGIKLKVVSLAGHTNGSIGVVYQNYLFAGDALVNRGKYPEIAFQNQNLVAAKRSYNKILKLHPEIIFVGHDREFSFDKLRNGDIL